MNLGGFAYYGSQWPFLDIMQGCSGSGTEYPPQAGEDANGFPVAINATGDQCANSASTNYLGQPCQGLYWVPGEEGLRLSNSAGMGWLARACQYQRRKYSRR